MKHSFEELIKKAKKVSLTKEERGFIEAKLVSFMGIFPVRNPDVGRQYYQRSNILSAILGIRNMPIVTAAMILALALGGGTAFAAQGSLPGDPLYPIKTNIDEKLMELATFSTQGKAKLEAQLATERLQEAEKLSARGKLTGAIQSSIQSNFEQHANNESDLVDKLQAQGNLEAAAEANSNFESGLSAHQNILSVLNIVPLNADAQDKVRASQSEAARLDQGIAAQSTTTMSIDAQERLATVSDIVNTANQILNSNENSIKATFFVQAQAQIGNADSAIAAARVKIAAGAYRDAFALLQQAQQLAEEVSAVVQDKSELNININADGGDSVGDHRGNDLGASSTGSTGTSSEPAGTINDTSTTSVSAPTDNTNGNGGGHDHGIHLNSSGLLEVQDNGGGASSGAKGYGDLNIGL